MKRANLLQLAGAAAVAASMLASGTARADNPCGSGIYPFPYTDVAGVANSFCPGILETFVTGISKGTSATTFSPNDTVNRTQMTTFLQRTFDQSVRRLDRRAALGQWWTPKSSGMLQAVPFTGASAATACVSDGQFVWISDNGHINQVQAGTGKLIQAWTIPSPPRALLAANGKIYAVSDSDSPGKLYLLDPTTAPGPVTVAATGLSNQPSGLGFDGSHLWTANESGGISMITPQAATPYPVTNITSGFVGGYGVLFDGNNIWVTDLSANVIRKIDGLGNVVQSVPTDFGPLAPVFDGTNIWVPNTSASSITVLQAATGAVVTTIEADTNNQLGAPTSIAFDGQRMLVTNSGNGSVTLFDAATLSLISNVSLGSSTSPQSACSDGVNFWIALGNAGKALRF